MEKDKTHVESVKEEKKNQVLKMPGEKRNDFTFIYQLSIFLLTNNECVP